MSDNTLGVLIILTIIGIGILSNGAIFGIEKTRSPNEPTEAMITSSIYATNENGLTPEERESAIYREISKAEEQVRQLKAEIEKNTENQNVSVHKNKVEISYVAKAGEFGSYVRLSAGSQLNQPITITGWKLRSTVTGDEQIISGASSIPYPNTSSLRPVALPRSGKVIVSTGQSPVGASFRVNKCTGYFAENNSTFTPELERMCPAPGEGAPAFSTNFNGACLDYISSLPRCEIPNEDNFPETLTSTCRQYLLTQVNYNSCVTLHQNDADFYKPEWRLYSERPRLLWLSERETIQLLDSSGKIVDTYSY